MRRQAGLIFLFFGILYILTNSFREAVQIPDEEYVLRVTSSLVKLQPLSLPDDVPRYPGAIDIGSDGKTYSSYQIGQSLVYAPFYFVINRGLSFSEPYDTASGKSRREYDGWLEGQTRRYLRLCPALFTAFSCSLLFLFAMRLGFTGTTSLILSLFFGLGTMAWPYSKYLLTESSQTTLLLLTVYLLYAQRNEGILRPKAMAAAGAAFGLLLAIRAIFAPLLAVLAIYWFYRNRERRLIAPLLCFAIPMFLLTSPQLLYDYIRFGTPLKLGYAGGGFSTPLYVGLFGYLASPGKGFFFYNSILLLGLVGAAAFFRRARQETMLIGAITLLVPLKYAAWWVWSGDPSWGPRYLLVLTPLLTLPAGEWVERAIADRGIGRRALLAGLFAVSAFVQLLAVSVHYLAYYQYVRANGSFIEKARYLYAAKTGVAVPMRDTFLETEFIPEYSPILGQWWVVKSLFLDRQKPGTSVPWRGLGFTALHADAPLRAEWDVWLINLVLHGLRWVNIRAILGGIALIIVFSIVGQELFSQVVARRRDD
ncbi:MAG: hypothetical protein V1495_07885 [Pseudomonadota bacterium]